MNTHRKLLASPRPLQSISRARIIVRPRFSSLQPVFRAYRAYHVYYITIRHKPKQLAAGLLNIATAEIFSGLEEEPLQMSTNFSNFLVYGMKSLKLALKVFKYTHRKPSAPPSDTMTQGGRWGGKRHAPWLLGFTSCLSKDYCLGGECC